MPYATPNDCRVRTVGMTTLVVPDVSSAGLNLTLCIAEADALIEEAARAGDYTIPFAPIPTRIRDLSAVGAIARARRALELGNQERLLEVADAYLQEFEQGLRDLRTGAMDLGTTTVSSEAVTMAADYSTWTRLGHGGLVAGSVTLSSSGGETVFVEERGAYDGDYLPEAVKDYEVDHVAGRVRRLSGGRIGAGAQLAASYEYYYRQPANAQDAEYAGTSVAVGEMRRED
jgi:hypothetical protein